MKLGFCHNCGKWTEYRVKQLQASVCCHSDHFPYIELQAHCEICDEEIYVPEINDQNVANVNRIVNEFLIK